MIRPTDPSLWPNLPFFDGEHLEEFVSDELRSLVPRLRSPLIYCFNAQIELKLSDEFFKLTLKREDRLASAFHYTEIALIKSVVSSLYEVLKEKSDTRRAINFVIRDYGSCKSASTQQLKDFACLKTIGKSINKGSGRKILAKVADMRHGTTAHIEAIPKAKEPLPTVNEIDDLLQMALDGTLLCIKLSTGIEIDIDAHHRLLDRMEHEIRSALLPVDTANS
jgi:hypothetical protein